MWQKPHKLPFLRGHYKTGIRPWSKPNNLRVLESWLGIDFDPSIFVPGTLNIHFQSEDILLKSNGILRH